MAWTPFPAWAVLFATLTPLAIIPTIIGATIKRLYGGGPKERPLSWGIVTFYLLYMFLDRKKPESGARTSSWARNTIIWPLGRRYFTGTLHKHTILRRDRSYLFGMHPHGVFCYSVWVNFLCNRNAFPELQHTRLATISNNFATPLLRDVMMALGFLPATKKALTNALKHQESTALLVGGAAEAQITSEKAIRLVLITRLGFVRVAIESDAPLVPIIHFRENQTFNAPFSSTVNDALREARGEVNNSTITEKFKNGVKGFQKWFLKTFTFSLPITFGVGGTILPHPVNVSCVTGDVPIDLRVLTQFYYFLQINQLPMGFTPQCPLGLAGIEHQHQSNALQTCFCHMKSNYNPNQILTQTLQSNQLQSLSQLVTMISQETTNIQHICTSLLSLVGQNRPQLLTQDEIEHVDLRWPYEYDLQQSKIDDYDLLLSSLPESIKKQKILKNYQKEKLKLQQDLNYIEKVQQFEQCITPQTNTISPEHRPHASTDKPQIFINKPCFLEEELFIPTLFPTSPSTSTTSTIPSTTNTPSQFTSTTPYHTVHYVNWKQLPDSLIEWLLLIYIGELNHMYHKYNPENDIPLELADFNMTQFCTKKCGIIPNTHLQHQIPDEIAIKYQYGIDIVDYLQLNGYNRTYLLTMLKLFLILKGDTMNKPLSLDGKSGIPFKNQSTAAKL